jgi:hypothetical protein
MPDPGGDIDDAAGMVERGFLLQALVRTLAVVAPRVPAQDLAGAIRRGISTRSRDSRRRMPASRSHMRSQVPGQQFGQSDNHRTVSPVRPRALDLPTQDRDLMAEHKDLRIFSGIIPLQENQPAEHPDN